MPRYDVSGESREHLFPAEVRAEVFEGVEILWIRGTKEQIRETTAILDDLYPDDSKRTLGDAYFIEAGISDFDHVYELIVVRKEKNA